MTKIEIPDDIAPILEAKAATEGLTLTEWVQKLATKIRDGDQGGTNNATSLRP
jgi:hypothetical protein